MDGFILIDVEHVEGNFDGILGESHLFNFLHNVEILMVVFEFLVSLFRLLEKNHVVEVSEVILVLRGAENLKLRK